jgi:hypothetical protein
MKIKPCKICGGKRVGRLTICYHCFLKRERAKRKLKLAKLKERKRVRREKKVNSYGYLKKAADKVFSQYVRMKGCDEQGIGECYTCGIRKHWKELHAGHFYHGKLDYDERNRRPQCPQCNTYKSGNLAIFGTKLAQELGAGGMKKLLLEANTKIYTWTELKQIIEIYKLKVGALESLIKRSVETA